MLGCLFLDMNSYFASVEQQFRPELRGRPVAVAAVEAETTCCIAASYEAKARGVRTGMLVREARRRCRGLEVVAARPPFYVKVHEAIKEAVELCLPVEKVCSIDEFHCRLWGAERTPAGAQGIAKEIKRTLRRQVGPYLRCSIGLAPNPLLAKIASDMRKPDGLTVIDHRDLPHALHGLNLIDLPGIGRNMLRRLHQHGMNSVEKLCACSERQLAAVWQSVEGRRWWHLLRGERLPEPPTRRQSVGHSHVLPPELRHDAGAYAVLVRLVHKAAARLRRMGYWARRMSVYVSYSYQEEGWETTAGLGQCQDTLTMLQALSALWPSRPRSRRPPTQVAVTLHNLIAPGDAAIPLFPEDHRRLQLARAMDAVNACFGTDTVYFAGMHDARESAPMRIAFTWIPKPIKQRGETAGG